MRSGWQQYQNSVKGQEKSPEVPFQDVSGDLFTTPAHSLKAFLIVSVIQNLLANDMRAT